MAKNAPRLTIFSFFACLWLIAAFVPAYGAGSRDSDLTRADQLIDAKEYDQAILLLTEYARRNPNDFDHAQGRLNKIYLLREEFNRTADELINLLLNDTGDDPRHDEKVLVLTTKLRSLENDNSPVLINFLERIHEIALFNVARNQLRRALENGRQLLDRGNFEGALAAYSGGFSIMRDEFYSAPYDALVRSQANAETERINSVIASFRQTASRLEAVTTEFTRAVNAGQHARVSEIMARLVPAMDDFIAQKQIVYASVSILERHLQNLQRANPDMGDRNHLAFVVRLVYGRTEQDIQEGILGAFDGFWKQSAGSSLEAISRYIENTNANGLNLFNRNDYAGAANALSGITTYENAIPVFFDKQRELTQITTAQTAVYNGQTIQRDSLPQYLKLVSLNEASGAIRRASAVPSREQYDRNTLVNLRAGRTTAQEAFNTEQETKNLLASQLSALRAIKSAAQETDAQISEHQNYPYIKNAIAAIDSLINRISTEESQSALRYYNIALLFFENNAAERKTQLETARGFMEGRPVQSPGQAMLILTPMLSAVNEDIELGTAYISELRDDQSGIASNLEARNLAARYQSLVNDLISIRDQGQAMAVSSQSRAAQAEALRREGERLFAEAQAAFQRREYETSLERIESSTRRLDESLALSESAEVREFRDTQLIRLSEQIVMAQNESVVAEVRNLVDSARNLYFAGNFQSAEDSLLRARNRWRIVSAEENAEITLWLGMVERAMTASSARVVPPTAPLYPEISQLLSQARRNYEEGIRLLNSGSRAQGIAKFDEARAQTKEVKLMFPVNQEAGILELRMEQFTDPVAFNADFERRLQTARAGTRQRSLESYADLLNLSEINPGYPGIRDIITQAEIDMGIRPPPPDPAAVARSNELTALARSILEQRAAGQYELALVQINEAIALNPLNNEAPRIKDQILNVSHTVESSASILSSEDEALYQQAMRDHQAGNNLVAYASIERIMQNPRNRNVQKVIELQQRIGRALGL